MLQILFWLMLTVPEGPPFLSYKNRRGGYVLEDVVKDVNTIDLYRLPLLIYIAYVLLGLSIYYWRIQLENDAVELTTVEWEVSMVVMCFFIKQATRTYLKTQFINKSNAAKGKIIRKGPIVFAAIIFLVIYILTSVFGLYHAYTDHHPVFAWVLFSFMLFFLFVLLQQEDVNSIIY